MNMKKTQILFLMLFQWALVWGQTTPQVPFKNAKFNANEVDRLQVESLGGSIKVQGSDARFAEVKVFIKKNNGESLSNQKEMDELLKGYEIQIGLSNGTLLCSAKSKENLDWKNRLQFNFEILSPVKINVDLKTSGGSINLQHLSGNLKFKTSGGSLHLKTLGGQVEGSTAGGSIELVDGRGKINLKTSGGSVKLENIKGTIDATSSGGSLHLAELNGDISVKTSGGSIDGKQIKGSLEAITAGGSINLENMEGNVKAITSGGSIKAQMLHLGKTLELKTSAGNVRASLPFSEGMNLDLSGSRIKSEKLGAVSKNLSSGKVRGKVNGGGTMVTISTSSGTVFID
jgi:Putative adhesin